MTRSSILVPACIALVVAILVAPPQAEAVAPAPPTMSCGTVTSILAPCFEYILSGGMVPINCCNGVKSLYKQADSVPKRRSVCMCLKSVTRTASPAVINNAKVLPGKCGVSLPYQISPAIDCAKVT